MIPYKDKKSFIKSLRSFKRKKSPIPEKTRSDKTKLKEGNIYGDEYIDS